MTKNYPLPTRVAAAALALAAAYSASSPAAANKTDNLRFEVFLDDERIGTHSFNFATSGDGVVMRSNASFDVRFLFLTAYRYRHQSTETWQDGCLTEIRSETDDNGKSFRVRGESRSAGFQVSGVSERVVKDDCVMSFAYWDPRILDERRLLNSQTGEVLDVDVTEKGRATLVLGDKEIDARKYQLTAEGMDITLWYDGNDQWLGLESRVGDGNRLRYKRL